MKRRLFCELNPFTYQLSMNKERLIRHLSNMVNHKIYCKTYAKENLEISLYKHKSLLMRKLGNSDLSLQENKKKNLALAAPTLDGILIKPNEVFSFWQIVGKCSEKKGFLKGVTISNGQVTPGMAGGMCQMTNLIHWMVLHSPLEIIEHHHHHRYDLFPDFKRQIPFGTGTSIMYNYLDYRFKNTSKDTFQLRIKVTDKYLEGELLVDKVQGQSYHIKEKNHQFIKEGEDYFRCNDIYRRVIDKRTGKTLSEELLISNKSKVMYDISHIS